MPNWCTDRLVVSGPKDDVAAFASATSTPEGRLSFALLYPVPEAEAASADGGYSWVVDHWGTKWDVSDEALLAESDVTGDQRVDVWDFTTAWSPPSGWAQHCSGLYPTLTFRLYFDEPGMCFAGLDVFQNGALQEDASWHGESLSWIVCAVADCESSDGDGPVAEHWPWEFDAQPDYATLQRVYCDEHRLVGLVTEQVRADAAAFPSTS